LEKQREIGKTTRGSEGRALSAWQFCKFFSQNNFISRTCRKKIFGWRCWSNPKFLLIVNWRHFSSWCRHDFSEKWFFLSILRYYHSEV